MLFIEHFLSDVLTHCVDLYPWLGGMIGVKIFSAMDQSNQEVEACGRLHPLPYKLLTFFKSPLIKITFQRIWVIILASA